MPIYTYQCTSCGNQFDVREGFDAPTVRDCTCGEKKTAQRVIHPVGVIYKGSGFYTTDYARRSSSGSNGSSNGGASKSTSDKGESKGNAEKSTSSDSSTTSASTSSDKS